MFSWKAGHWWLVLESSCMSFVWISGEVEVRESHVQEYKSRFQEYQPGFYHCESFLANGLTESYIELYWRDIEIPQREFGNLSKLNLDFEMKLLSRCLCRYININQLRNNNNKVKYVVNHFTVILNLLWSSNKLKIIKLKVRFTFKLPACLSFKPCQERNYLIKCTFFQRMSSWRGLIIAIAIYSNFYSSSVIFLQARSGSGRHNSTDTNMTELSSNQDDSGIGRTDESVKTDESSEQVRVNGDHTKKKSIER